MKLRLKVLLILASMWAIIALVMFLYSKSTFTHEYARLETKEVTEDLQRVNKSLTTLFMSLKLLNNDWSQWDDAYRFMQDKNTGFIKSNMAFTTFENSKINLILFFDPTGKLFYGLNYDLNKNQFIAIPQDLITRMEVEKTFTRQSNASSGKIGLVKANGGYIVLSAMPILTSEGKGPIAGTLVMGYYLNDNHIAELSNIVQMKVHLFPLPIPKDNVELNLVSDNLSNGALNYIAVERQDLIAGYTYIRDIEKSAIGILRIEVPRILYTEGIRTINSYLGIVISIGMIFLFSVWYLLKIFVMDRILLVSKQVIDITEKSKFETRIKTQGKDELEDMVIAINSLIEIIELTESQLKYRIFLRTEELERLSKLNKNLYTEMGNQRMIESRLREGEKALRTMAYYDSLTGLPNRVYLYEMMKKLVSQAEHQGSRLAVLFLDANKFKSINDTYGHDIGDKFLRHAAQQLKASIKETDIAARLAGDEFIICLNNIHSKSEIMTTVDNILQKISAPLQVDQFEIIPTFSMGISIYPEDGKSVEELEKHADLAMYFAKGQPNSSYCFYDEVACRTPSE